MFRLSTNSSKINIFTQSKHNYELVLKNSGYKTKLVYKTTDETSNVCGRGKNRSRKILWFMLRYNMAVGKEFLKLSKKNFHPLNKHEIFNKNTVKL